METQETQETHSGPLPAEMQAAAALAAPDNGLYVSYALRLDSRPAGGG